MSGKKLTLAEMRAKFLDHMCSLVHYWSRVPVDPGAGNEATYRLSGLLHSFLVTLDGCSALPAFDLIPASRGGEEHWPKVVLNDCQLHEMVTEFMDRCAK